MTPFFIRWLLSLLVLSSLSFVNSLAFAQAYPVKPVRFVTIFAAGSSGDLFIRIFSSTFAELRSAVAEPFYVDLLAKQRIDACPGASEELDAFLKTPMK
jgi:tripartite-type tricarboxylate transporter receptor subunit TctC